MNIFYPTLKRAHLPMIIGITWCGGLVGGIYGIIHDLITYSISKEYYTRMKFDQFSHMDIGLPRHLFAAQIGFITAGAVGLAGGWFIARTVVPVWSGHMALKKAMQAFLLMLMVAMAVGVLGYGISLNTGISAILWNSLGVSLGVRDIPAFLQVASIHASAYLGAILGISLAIIHLRRAATIHENPHRRT